MNKKNKTVRWKITEYCSGTITVRTPTEFVCRCSGNEKGRKYANRISRLPELYNELLNELTLNCGICKSHTVGGEIEHPELVEDCPIDPTDHCFCPVRKRWQLLKKVRDGK